MKISKKMGIALVAVGVLALSACGNSTAELLESPESNTKNAALEDTSGLNVKAMTFKRESLNGWESKAWGVGLEDQILRDESKNTACPNGVTSVANIDSASLTKISQSCGQSEFLLVHYTGFITVPGTAGETVAVKFRVAKDDTFSMKIDGKTIVDDWHNSGCAWLEGKIDMVAGKKYPLDAWFSQFRGGICNQMTWSVAGGTQVVVPSSALSRVDDTPVATTTTVAEETATENAVTTTTAAEQPASGSSATTTTVAEETASGASATTTVAEGTATENAATATTVAAAGEEVTSDTMATTDEEVATEASDTTIAEGVDSEMMETEGTESEAGSGDSDSSSNIWWLLILLLIILGGGGYAYSRKKK